MRSLTLFLLPLMLGCAHKAPEINTGLKNKPMPNFNLLLMDSTTTINTISIPEGKPVVMFLFNPFCPFCKAQTEDIKDHIKEMQNIQFVLLSPIPFTSVKGYYDKYNLKDYKNLIVGNDKDNFFASYFKAPGVPYIAIYNSNKILKHVFIGNIETNLIKEMAKN